MPKRGGISRRWLCGGDIAMKPIYWLWRMKWKILFWGIGLTFAGLVAYWAVNPNQAPTWTGFRGYTKPNGGVVPPKNLWDWLNLLIVPAALVVGAWWLNRAEKQRERESINQRAEFDRRLAEDRNRELALQAYLDHMTELLLTGGLREAKEGDEIRSIARAKTITVLRILDPVRKGLLLRFLREAGLLEEPTVNIKWADLSEADLRKANLANASLRNVNFERAQLTQAYLFRADLRGATFCHSVLYRAKIISANLRLAQMKEANLSEADFTESDLSIASLYKVIANNVNFQQANLRSADLSESNLQGAIFTGANLTMAKLVNADLRNADFTGANCRGADLSGANLVGAKLQDADLSLVNFANAKISREQLMQAKSVSLAVLPMGEE